MSGKRKVIVAVSGGVDSSVAAALLKSDYDVIAVHLTKNDLAGRSDEIRRREEESARSAAAVTAVLGIPLRFVEAGREFDRLIDRFCAEYNAGRTPNPCVLCNQTIKWRLLLECAEAESADFVATGHYAQIESRGGAAHLVRSCAGNKDQTYFLHRLTQAELARTLFPLAGMTKGETWAVAGDLGLPTFERSESQEICFVGDGGYRKLILSRTGGQIRAGDVVDAHGRRVGRHDGYQFYTIGQRKGMGIALGKPAYVVAIDAANARVTLGGADELLKDCLTAADVNWIVPPAPREVFRAVVRIRYNHRGANALVTPRGESAEVEFEEPVRAVTAGQAAVFYAGDECVGGGWIA